MATLNIAEEDLNSSKLNYEAKSYRKSMEDLQQSAEKTSKAYGKMFFFFESKLLRKQVGHKSPLVFAEMTKPECSRNYIELMKAVRPSMKIDVTELEEMIKKSETEIATISYDEIKLLLTTLENIKRLLESNEKMIDDELQQLKENELVKYNERLHRLLDTLKANSINKLLYAYITMFHIATLTYPHFVRYDDEKININIYNENLGVVMAAPELFSLVENSIIVLKEFVGTIIK
jgi:hypothetical protein